MNDYNTTDFRIRRKRTVRVELRIPDILAERLVKGDCPLLLVYLSQPPSSLSYHQLPLLLPLHPPKNSMEWSEVKHTQKHVINKLKRKFTT